MQGLTQSLQTLGRSLERRDVDLARVGEALEGAKQRIEDYAGAAHVDPGILADLRGLLEDVDLGYQEALHRSTWRPA